MTYYDALTAQQDRARQLADRKCCPHCAVAVPLLDALSIVRGHGSEYFVRIQLPDGQMALVPERDFSPQTMLWADESRVWDIQEAIAR